MTDTLVILQDCFVLLMTIALSECLFYPNYLFQGLAFRLGVDLNLLSEVNSSL